LGTRKREREREREREKERSRERENCLQNRVSNRQQDSIVSARFVNLYSNNKQSKFLISINLQFIVPFY
jgi:hypothetical protein